MIFFRSCSLLLEGLVENSIRPSAWDRFQRCAIMNLSAIVMKCQAFVRLLLERKYPYFHIRSGLEFIFLPLYFRCSRFNHFVFFEYFFFVVFAISSYRRCDFGRFKIIVRYCVCFIRRNYTLLPKNNNFFYYFFVNTGCEKYRTYILIWNWIFIKYANIGIARRMRTPCYLETVKCSSSAIISTIIFIHKRQTFARLSCFMNDFDFPLICNFYVEQQILKE